MQRSNTKGNAKEQHKEAKQGTTQKKMQRSTGRTKLD